jgi:hypothetical protein
VIQDDVPMLGVAEINLIPTIRPRMEGVGGSPQMTVPHQWIQHYSGHVVCANRHTSTELYQCAAKKIPKLYLDTFKIAFGMAKAVHGV